MSIDLPQRGDGWWADMPLGAHLESILGKSGKPEAFGRGQDNWVRFLSAFSDSTSILVRSLSQQQLASAKILLEWTYRRTYDSNRSRISGETPILPPLPSGIVPILLPLPVGIGNFILNIQTKPSVYRQELERLWHFEFWLHNEDINDKTPVLLRQLRQQVARTASCQRTAWSYFRTALASESPGLDPFLCEEVISNMPSEVNLGAEGIFRNISTVIDPCPWLRHQKTSSLANGTEDDLPAYLWEVRSGHTVKTCDMDSHPNYTVISHTWGRWRTKHSVKVEGALWPVPQNSRFNVKKLPEILRGIPLADPYIWIDLLCIPQDPSSKNLMTTLDREVERQATIFRSAARGLIWLNDVTSWDGLQPAIEWLALAILMFSSDNDWVALQHLFISRTSSANVSTGLFQPANRFAEHSIWERLWRKPFGKLYRHFRPSAASSHHEESASTPSGWFTSLWTLQEAALRPDMILIDQNCQALSLGGGNTVLTLADLVALLSQFDQLYLRGSRGQLGRLWEEVPVPKGPSELRQILLNGCQFHNLFELNPINLLAMGNQRFCKGKRARAIMSALGATDWFHSATQQTGENLETTDLVLGRYPLAFLNEVRSKVGASFFSSSNSEFSVVDTLDLDTKRVRVVGSMLPFSSNEHRPKSGWVWEVLSQDHPSVKNWVVQADGSVLIRQAGIIASSHNASSESHPNTTPIAAQILAPKVNQVSYEPELHEYDLQQWLNEFQPAFPTYAVALCTNGPNYLSYGILLHDVGIWDKLAGRRQESAQNSGSGEVLLVKVGNFTLNDVAIEPKKTDVTWRVI